MDSPRLHYRMRLVRVSGKRNAGRDVTTRAGDGAVPRRPVRRDSVITKAAQRASKDTCS
jgi:hypothetical protein